MQASEPIRRERVVLAKTAWSDGFDSLGVGDDPRGNHQALKRGKGNEAFNFKRAPVDGLYYGYFRAHGGKHGGGLDLKRIDKSASGSQLDGVTIIWVARPREGGLRIIGWYRNAKLFDQTRTEDSPWHHPLYKSNNNAEGKGSYICTAPSDDSVILPPDERVRWLIPKSVSSRMGRTDVLYPQTGDRSGRIAPWVTEFEKTIFPRIQSHSRVASPGADAGEERDVRRAFHGQGLSPDPKKRKFIETTAMKHAKAHFESLGFKVKDVSSHSPFDLECEGAGEKLQVEVKGTSGDGSTVLLTEREFRYAVAPGWSKVLFVLPEITMLANGTAIVGNARIINPFDPTAFDSNPTHHMVRLENKRPRSGARA